LSNSVRDVPSSWHNSSASLLALVFGCLPIYKGCNGAILDVKKGNRLGVHEQDIPQLIEKLAVAVGLEVSIKKATGAAHNA
jgi:hypothetical protein